MIKYLLILFPFICFGQDSIYLSTDKPLNGFEDNPLTIGMKFTPGSSGRVKALKFYKTDATVSTIVLWDVMGLKLVQGTISGIGWQRLATDIPVTSGNTYTISATTNPGRYGYVATLWPIKKGQLTGVQGYYSYGTAIQIPTIKSANSYFLDVVVQSSAIVQIPLTVKVLPERIDSPYTTNPIKVTGNISGSYVSFKWEVLEQVNNITVSDTNTLTPVIHPNDSSGCSMRLSLTAIDVNGIEQYEYMDVYVMPSNDQIIMVGTRGGKFFYIRRVVIID